MAVRIATQGAPAYLNGLSLAIEGGRIVARFVCVVCKKPILNESDGIALGHDMAGLGPIKWWITHRRCMGPCTHHISLMDVVHQLDALYSRALNRRH